MSAPLPFTEKETGGIKDNLEVIHHMNIKIVIGEDHETTRNGIRQMLEKNEDMKVIGEAADGNEVVVLARELKPDVIFMDITMPGLNGINATRKIMDEAPASKVIALSFHCDERMIKDMFRAGAMAYLYKDCSSVELIEAVREVVAGRRYLSPTIRNLVVEGYAGLSEDSNIAVLSPLSEREREVLQGIAEGCSTKEMAGNLHVTVKCVEKCRHDIMMKLNLHTMADLVKYAVRAGITPP